MMFFFVPLLAVFLLLFLSDSLEKTLDRKAGSKRKSHRRAQAPAEGFIQTLSSTGQEVKRGYSELQVQVFRLAARNKGCITLSDVIVETGLDVDKAEKLMDRMVDGAHVQIEVNDKGMITYEFPELITGIEPQEV